MPRHKHPLPLNQRSDSIVCAVCHAYEGRLTTDCPGTTIDHAKMKELWETTLDYTDARGWHLADSTAPMRNLRSPRFEDANQPPEPPHDDPRKAVAPEINWTRIDQHQRLQHELTLKAVAWAIADRACEDVSATCTCLEDEADALRDLATEKGRAILSTLKTEKIAFHKACRHVERCEEEFKQAARRLVDALEERPLLSPGEAVPEGPPF